MRSRRQSRLPQRSWRPRTWESRWRASSKGWDRIPEGREARRLLRLNYYVRVYAKAPRLNFLNGFDVHNSPVPYGVPMHSDMLKMMSPNPLYPPAANLGSILGWSWRAIRP